MKIEKDTTKTTTISTREITGRINGERIVARIELSASHMYPGWETTEQHVNECNAETALLDSYKKMLCKRIRTTVDEHGFVGIAREGNVTLSCLDLVIGLREVKKHHGTGKWLGVVSAIRTIVYAKSSKFRESSHTYNWLCGENETGTTFAHAIPAKISTVPAAISWIWNGNEITARQGDVAIAPAKATIKTWIFDAVRVIDSHYVCGLIAKRGNSLYVKQGTIHHAKDQHADIVVSSPSVILIGRRSANVTSSAD